MHDFEAANSDELELKRGDVVLVVPTESVEDQVRILLTHLSVPWLQSSPMGVLRDGQTYHGSKHIIQNTEAVWDETLKTFKSKNT